MLEAFRRLPPIGRIIVIALGFSVLIGIILLISLLITGGTAGGKKAGDPGGAGTSTITNTPEPSTTFTTAIPHAQPSVSVNVKLPKPTDVPNDQQPQDSGLSKAVLSTAYVDVLRGVTAYCTFPKGEDKAARAKRLTPYFNADSDLLSDNNDFITEQQCKMLAGDVLNSDGKNALNFTYYMSVSTQYLQSDLSDNQTETQLKDYSYGVHAVYTNGKWIIDTIDVQ